ncbi:hypothetical protein ACLMJK_001760 [Lecanora helva]
MLGVGLSFICLLLIHLSIVTGPISAQPLGQLSARQGHNPQDRVTQRAAPSTPSAITAGRATYRIPRSDLILVLRPRGGVRTDSIESILLTADTWVARKISIFGPDSPTDAIFQYGTGEKPYTRLIVWSTADEFMTWGQVKTVIDGLWSYVVDGASWEYTYWEIYESEVTKTSQIGYGAIVETDSKPRNPLFGLPPNITTSKRALTLPAPLTSNDLGAPNLATTPFSLPGSNLKFEFYDSGSQIPHKQLNSMLISAAAELDKAEEVFGFNTPSSGQEYVFGLDEGVHIWLLKEYRPPLGYLTYGQLREMIAGLQMYMVLGRRPWSVRFRLTYGDRKVVLGHGALGNLGPPDLSSNVTLKAES